MVVQYLKNNCFNINLFFLRFLITKYVYDILQGLEVQSKRRRLENTPLKLRLRYLDFCFETDQLIIFI